MCAKGSVKTTLYSLFSILYSLFSILYSLFSILYPPYLSLFSIPYSLCPILHHPTNASHASSFILHLLYCVLILSL
jgi:hypothetical protein